MRLKRKGYGRIFTDSKENIAKIRELIHAMDRDEYDYLPDDLIAVYVGFDEVVYNGKFYDLNLDELAERCQLEGIPCRIVVADDTGIDGSDSDVIPKNCKLCGGAMVWENPHITGHFHESSCNIEDWPICHECMVEHCCQTNCLGCEYGRQPDCRFLDLKRYYMAESKHEE